MIQLLVRMTIVAIFVVLVVLALWLTWAGEIGCAHVRCQAMPAQLIAEGKI